jgi:hypothetical protein
MGPLSLPGGDSRPSQGLGTGRVERHPVALALGTGLTHQLPQESTRAEG